MTPSLFAGLLAAGSTALAVMACGVRADRTVLRRIDPSSGGGRAFDAGRVVAAVGTLAGRFPGLSRLLDRRTLAARLTSTGVGLSLDSMAGLASLAAMLLGLVTLTGPWPLPLLCPIVVVGALRAPALVLGRLERRRRMLADAELPQLLDLLAAASSAGLSGPAALGRAAATTTGPLADELAVALQAVELGARWRDELHRLADRLSIPELGRAVGALTRSEALGSSLADAVTALATDVRAAHRARAAERARRAPVSMLFPLVFLVLPAFLLLTVVPVLITTLQSIR